jgi:DNA-binding GntR family transcriptional regulator
MSEPTLRRRPQTVAKIIAEELRDRILTGEIPSGTRLQQNDVAAQFDVSSTPVREAFAELRRQGLVSGTERRGVRVFRPTPRDVIEASEVQELLEAPCIAASAPLLTDADLATAQRLLAEHRAIPAHEWRARLELDTAFHLAFLVRCPNAKLRDMAEAAHRDTVAHKLVLASVGDTAERFAAPIDQQHQAILDACTARDGTQASARTIDHIRWACEVWRGTFDPA